MRIHILGHGPIAEHLYRLLSKSSEVFIYSEREIQFLNSKTKSYEDFITQRLNDRDVIVIAWRGLPHVGGIKREVLNYLRGNIQVSNMVIYLSSVAVYGQNLTYSTEDTVPLPINIYGKSKYELERYLQDFLVCKLFVLRLSNVFGDSRFSDLINKIILTYLNHETLELYSAAEIERDFISVTTVVECIERLLTATSKTVSFEIFNISSGESITLERVVSLAKEFLEDNIAVQNLQATSSTIVLSRVPNIKFVRTFAYPIKDQIEELRGYLRETISPL
jgi:nucleoside-diphosphate-sugar epimerase